MIITEEQQTQAWHDARSISIGATDYAEYMLDKIAGLTKKGEPKRRSGIKKILDAKVYGLSEEMFDPAYAQNGHAREKAILARLGVFLGKDFIHDQTAFYDDYTIARASLDGYCNLVVGEAKTTTINSANFIKNFTNNCKKWRYQLIHQYYCSKARYIHLGVEFQERIINEDGSTGFSNNKDFLAVDFLTGEIIIDDIAKNFPELSTTAKEIIQDHLYFDKSITEEVWLATVKEIWGIVVDAKSNLEF